MLHTLRMTIGQVIYSQSLKIFRSRCLVAASNSGLAPSFEFPNCPKPRLSPSHCNSSQQLNTRAHMTKSNLCYYRRSFAQCLLVSGHHLGSVNNFSFSFMEIFFGPLRFLSYGASSLTRGRVCIVQLLLDSASAIFLESESHENSSRMLRNWFSL
jgi:hypothetical protein